MENVVVDMIEVARQTATETTVNFGDSLTFRVEVDLPKIPEADKTDIVIELFGLKPDTGNCFPYAFNSIYIIKFFRQKIQILCTRPNNNSPGKRRGRRINK